MSNGDFALFAWRDSEAYWIGNTETPSALWQTRKHSFEEVPAPIAYWAQRVLLKDLYRQAGWLSSYPNLSWYFLPVFLSKDGRHTSREFFQRHAAGFPDTDPETALRYYDSFLGRGVLDGYRYTMASKLGTSQKLDLGRMSAAMAEFNAAKILVDSGHTPVPEAEVNTGHSIDFRVGDVLVEVTRPLPPARRAVSDPSKAVRDTANTKSNGQLKEHGGDILLFVDASSFNDSAWKSVCKRRPDVSHHPAVVFRVQPAGGVEGYQLGDVPLDLEIDRI